MVEGGERNSMNITVNIGRNQGTEPMPTDEWEEFKAEVKAEVEVVANLFQYGEVTGYWEGQEETAYTVAGQLTTPPYNLKKLHHNLAGLARTFRQSAIAVTLGHPTFVEPLEWDSFVEWSKARTHDRIIAEIDLQLVERGIID